MPPTQQTNQINKGRAKAMNSNMQGHNHGGKSHLLWMLGIGGAVLAVQLGLGRSFSQALPLAFFVACPLMMIGMMFMMGGGNGHQHGSDAHDPHDAHGTNDDNGAHEANGTTEHRDHHDHHASSNQRGNDVAAPWQDSPNMNRPQDTAGPDRPRR